MYKLIRTISLFLRTFILPNPFERYFELYLQNTMWASASSSVAYLFNLVIGGTLLWIICYLLVGIVYDKGECPSVGSILYLVFLFINSYILVLISNWTTSFDIKTFSIKFGLAFLLEVIILIGIRRLKEYSRYY